MEEWKFNNKNKEEYNNIPIYYCKHCLSLKIRNVPIIEDSDYCDECGATNVGITSIEDWENQYVEKYGFKYIENTLKK